MAYDSDTHVIKAPVGVDSIKAALGTSENSIGAIIRNLDEDYKYSRYKPIRDNDPDYDILAYNSVSGHFNYQGNDENCGLRIIVYGNTTALRGGGKHDWAYMRPLGNMWEDEMDDYTVKAANLESQKTPFREGDFRNFSLNARKGPFGTVKISRNCILCKAKNDGRPNLEVFIGGITSSTGSDIDGELPVAERKKPGPLTGSEIKAPSRKAGNARVAISRFYCGVLIYDPSGSYKELWTADSPGVQGKVSVVSSYLDGMSAGKVLRVLPLLCDGKIGQDEQGLIEGGNYSFLRYPDAEVIECEVKDFASTLPFTVLVEGKYVTSIDGNTGHVGWGVEIHTTLTGTQTVTDCVMYLCDETCKGAGNTVPQGVIYSKPVTQSGQALGTVTASKDTPFEYHIGSFTQGQIGGKNPSWLIFGANFPSYGRRYFGTVIKRQVTNGGTTIIIPEI